MVVWWGESNAALWFEKGIETISMPFVVAY